MLNFGNKEFRNLQEQVLKNAQDIETLKGRENLQVVIVNELPEVGNPNYIYLVAKDDGESPDVYDEYIWLEDEERYELIGGVSIDLTNYVTTNTAQTITGAKTFSGGILLSDGSDIVPVNDGQVSLGSINKRFPYVYANRLVNNYGALSLTGSGGLSINLISAGSSVKPTTNDSYNIGADNAQWKDLYLGGKIYIGTYTQIYESGNSIYINNSQGNPIFVNSSIRPLNTNSKDLGSSSLFWKDLYLVGNITDGVNTVSVANIASKVTSAYASGTFDANGESTIDISGGTPEGLFVFTYGNCECFVRLTATMVQNADAVPINVSCPMIRNNTVSLGWLQIYRSSDTLTITVTDGNNHVDSGYAWTLTKTNLI